VSIFSQIFSYFKHNSYRKKIPTSYTPCWYNTPLVSVVRYLRAAYAILSNYFKIVWNPGHERQELLLGSEPGCFIIMAKLKSICIIIWICSRTLVVNSDTCIDIWVDSMDKLHNISFWKIYKLAPCNNCYAWYKTSTKYYITLKPRHNHLQSVLLVYAKTVKYGKLQCLSSLWSMNMYGSTYLRYFTKHEQN
jgi:hypothetical protein